MGHTVESESKAQMGLGITVPYISPLLIRARLLGTNQGIQETIAIREALWVDIGRFRNPLMHSQKACSTWPVWFSCHHYLTVREQRRRVC